MTGRLANGRAGLRMWAHRWLMLALPQPLFALAAAAFAVAPTSNAQRAVAPDERPLPPSPPAVCLPARAIGARSAVTGAAVPGGEHALYRPQGAGGRWRVEH